MSGKTPGDAADTETLNRRGIGFAQRGEHDAAAACFRQALAQEPRYADAYNNLGNVLLLQGKLSEAVANYYDGLRLLPDDADLRNNLSHAFCRQGRLDDAVALARQALHLRPGFAEAYNNLGMALETQGNLADADASYREALRIQPGLADARDNLARLLGQRSGPGQSPRTGRPGPPPGREPSLEARKLNDQGLALAQQGKPEEAIGLFQRAIEIQPDFAQAYSNLGAALSARGELGQAEQSLRRALQLRPEYTEALAALGWVLDRVGRLDEAISCFREAVRLKPTWAEVYNSLGLTLEKAKRFDESIDTYRAALRTRPGFIEALNNLAIVLDSRGRSEEAIDYYEQALAQNPNHAQVHTNLGVALGRVSRYADAEEHLRKALAIEPNFAEAQSNLGCLLLARGKPAEGLVALDRAIELRPDYAKPHMYRAMAWLQQGDFERGWREYEWRWGPALASPRPFRQPPWDGSPLDGRSILLYWEQGLGDTIQFIRFAEQVKERGGKVIVECQDAVAPLLTGCPFVDQVVGETCIYIEAAPGAKQFVARPRSGDFPLPDFDVQAPLLSLPRILGTTVATIPVKVPYLFAEAERVARWRRELEPNAGFRVGIAWQGNPDNVNDRKRSMPLETFAPLAAVPGVQLVSLQKGPGTEQLADARPPFPILDLGSRFESGGDAAAAIVSLDLVITACTAVAHCAGALGRPVWTLLTAYPDWRWMLDAERSPWYPTMRLFRQTNEGDWEEVLSRVAEALEARTAGPS